MAVSGGKYGDLAQMAYTLTLADAVVLIVLNGNKGSGFSLAGHDDIVPRLPELLREMAQQIENDTRGDSNVDQG